MSKPRFAKTNRSAESAARQFGETTLDNRTPVATPENVAFRYEVAGPFTRLLALALDFLILAIVIVILGVIVFFASASVATFAKELGMVALMIFALFCFALLWLYGVICETLWGKTIGKWVLRLRVLTSDGRPISATQAVLRNFLRMADLLPPMSGGIGLIVMSMNRRYQRLGDLAAGTIVIQEGRKFHHTVDFFEDHRVAQLAEYIPASFKISNELSHTLSMYVQRRELFSIERTREIASHLAVPLLLEFGLPNDTSYDLLLCALYYRTFLMTENRKEIEWKPPQLQQSELPAVGPVAPQHQGYRPASQPLSTQPTGYRPVYQPPQIPPQPANPNQPGDGNTPPTSPFGGRPPGYG